LALLDGDTDSFVEDVTARTNSIEPEVESESIVAVNQCHVGKEVNASADVPKHKRVKRLKPRKSAVDALMKSDSTAAEVATESVYTTADGLSKSNNTSVDTGGKPYNAILDSDRELDGIVVDFGRSDNNTIDTVGQLNTTTREAPIDLDNATDQVIGDFDNAEEVPQESTVVDMLDTIGVAPITSEYDMMDLDIPEPRSSVETEATDGASIEAASTLYTVSQYNGWEMVNEPRMTRQDGRQGFGSKMSTGIDPKELLERWDWVFQRK